MLKIEMKKGNLSLKEKALSWLKAGKSGMLPLWEWIKCGIIIIFRQGI
jgi:hypothetical protein